MPPLHRLVTRSTWSTRATEHPRASQPPAPAPSLAAAIVQALARGGYTHCFGIPGRHVQALFHALPESGLRPILTRHEQGAVFMADGFARASGRPAVVVSTAGPGAGNMVTGVANAFAEGTPLLCLTGASPRRLAGRGAFQELGDDHGAATDALFAPITRFHGQVGHVAAAGPALSLAATAMAAGGPAVITIPADVLEAPSPGLPPASLRQRRATPDPDDVAAAAALLADHPNAVILAGRGALGATDELRALAERLQIPVLTTLHGRGAIDEDHPLALGPQGFGASAWAEAWLKDHVPDVVLAVGTSLREISTNVYTQAFQGRVGLIHVTRDAGAIDRHFRASVGAVADVGRFLAALSVALPVRSRNEGLATWKASVPRFDAAALDDGPGRVSPRRVIEAVRRALGPEDVFLADTGNAVPWSVRYYPVHRPGEYLVAMHLAAMGWGLAAAIGVQLAKPAARVVAVVGDGCFQMAGMEIATAVQYGLPVVWVVLNDARLNMVYQGSTVCYGQAVPNCELSPVNCARVAEGLGAVGFRVDDPAELDAVLSQALACGRPAVVDVAVDPDARPSMAGRFEALQRLVAAR